ncbi:MAG: hypothetical protein ACLQQ4_14525 [Bacteroidia bacterium]
MVKLKYKKLTLVLLLAIIIVSIGKSQDKILPMVKITLDSLYPKATIISIWRGHVNHNIQEVEIKCNCQESKSEMALWFDTNGNMMNKDIYVDSLKGLPDTILNYMKSKESQSDKFDYSQMVKSINYKGEISYGIYVMELSTDGYKAMYRNIIKFKSDGVIISKARIINRR